MGDGASTLAGRAFGKKCILASKTLEGSLALFFVSLTAVMFLPLLPVVAGAVAAAIAELLPEARPLRKLKERGLVDDNLLIPILAGSVMWTAVLLM